MNKNLKYPAEIVLPILISVVVFMEFLDGSIINTAIPTIAKSFLISPILLKFSVASYFLSIAIFIPVSGWCADRFGTKPMFLFAVALFTVSSFLCGISTNIVELTIFRFLQGIGGAFMNPIARIIIIKYFSPKDLIRVYAIVFTPAMFGRILGPFLGGIISTYWGWNWIFYINIPIGMLALYIGHRYIENQSIEEVKPFDHLGFILAGLSLVLITFSIEMLNHYDIISQNSVFLIGVVGLILFIILILHCYTKVNAVFDLALFQIKTFKIGLMLEFTQQIISACILFLLPLMYQDIFNLSAAASGMLVLPIAFGFLGSRAIASNIMNRVGIKRLIVLASFALFISIVLIANFKQNTPTYYIAIVEVIYGVSWILVGATNGVLNYVDIDKQQTSMATSIDMTVRGLSSSLGIGIGAFVLTSLSNYLSIGIFDHSNKVFHYTIYFMAFFPLLNILIGLKLSKNAGAHVLKKKTIH